MSLSLSHATPGLAAALRHAVQGLRARLAAESARRRDRIRTLRALHGLSEHELDDLGIGTADFAAIAEGRFADRRDPAPAPRTAPPGGCVVLYFPPRRRHG